MLHEALVEYSYGVTPIHRNVTQDDRDKVVKELKEGFTNVLISTNLLARGFDQSKVNLVVNYDLPVYCKNYSEPDNDAYLHRICRAGRFGRKAAFNLLCGDKDHMIMEKIERHFNHSVAKVPSWTSDEDSKDALRKAGLMYNFSYFSLSYTQVNIGCYFCIGY
ncbi:putative RNA helicase [Helianthus anomalus]